MARLRFKSFSGTRVVAVWQLCFSCVFSFIYALLCSGLGFKKNSLIIVLRYSLPLGRFGRKATEVVAVRV